MSIPHPARQSAVVPSFALAELDRREFEALCDRIKVAADVEHAICLPADFRPSCPTGGESPLPTQALIKFAQLINPLMSLTGSSRIAALI